MGFTARELGLYLSQSPQSHRVLKKSADPVEQQGVTEQEGGLTSEIRESILNDEWRILRFRHQRDHQCPSVSRLET